VAAFAGLPVSLRVVEALAQGTQRKVGGLWGASTGLFVAMVARALERPLLVVTADDDDSATLASDVATFVPGPAGPEPLVLPERAWTLEDRPEPLREGARTRALSALLDRPRALLIASVKALLDDALAPSTLAGGRVVLERGQTASRDAVAERGLAAGLRKVPLLLAPGELSVRGDVLDLWPLAAEAALRLEFFGGSLESIRTFDAATQGSLGELDRVELSLPPATEATAVPAYRHVVKKGLVALRHEPLRLKEREQKLAGHAGKELMALQLTLAGLPLVEQSSLPSHDLDYRVLSAGSAAGSGEADPLGRLNALRSVTGSIRIWCRSEDERHRLAEIFAHRKVDLGRERVELAVGSLSRGFRLQELGTTEINNLEFAGVAQAARVQHRPILPSKAVQSFFELGPNDLVVHAAHGIARFLGLEQIERGGVVEEHMRLEFQGDVQLLMPASKIHLVQKYIGAGAAAPKLDRLGSKGFARRKEEVFEAVYDMAADLLEVQAQRERTKRPPHERDELEAAFLDGFPFTDTPDQATSWAEIRQDLEKDWPMDRLLCGDVGFGKTELALRAAFKVAVHGRQVAVLVPTTVLADQHLATFAARLAPFGLTVELLSRYRTGRRRTETLKRLGEGKVDVLVGTHALLSERLAFKDLGLLVVDEEQRFGVRHKEALKKVRTAVDVLTLSATPIPRTLHGSLLGIRPISTLATPPPGRQEIETRVLWRAPDVLERAIAHEVGRGGQVFVLHNRIADLPVLAREIGRLVPSARVAIGHGQMTEKEMEKTVRAFVAGQFDVLVSTTIVENGLDLPRANTILIERADLFGLAELHQLRGRVGRSDHKAYCFLLMDRDAPPDEEARKRLKAIEEFSHLGSGFAIAIKDLEIRGAGNLLGPQQSGHIAAIGYEMYCRLLREAVHGVQQKGERPRRSPWPRRTSRWTSTCGSAPTCRPSSSPTRGCGSSCCARWTARPRRRPSPRSRPRCRTASASARRRSRPCCASSCSSTCSRRKA
jgi:transcription-repair coupling factor (superfamily II helicase)